MYVKSTEPVAARSVLTAAGESRPDFGGLAVAALVKARQGLRRLGGNVART